MSYLFEKDLLGRIQSSARGHSAFDYFFKNQFNDIFFINLSLVFFTHFLYANSLQLLHQAVKLEKNYLIIDSKLTNNQHCGS